MDQEREDAMAKMFLGFWAAAVIVFVMGCTNRDQTRYDNPPEASYSGGTAQQVFAQARKEMDEGQYAQAEARLGEWLEARKGLTSCAEGYYLLGLAQFKQDKFAEAKESQDKAEELAVDRTLKAKAKYARAHCNFKMEKYQRAKREYVWIEEYYRDVREISHEELLFQIGLCAKRQGQIETADHWFEKVIECYGSGKMAELARAEHSRLGPKTDSPASYYALEVASYPQEEEANTEAEIYRQKGYAHVRVVPGTKGYDPCYRIMIGKFVNKNDAERAKDEAELAGLSAQVRPDFATLPR
jgi:tetratricopeptide (TPR) repeat protein